MVGSYPPKETTHSFTTPEEDIPHGALARGTYTVHSLFTDDDKNEHLKVIFIDNTRIQGVDILTMFFKDDNIITYFHISVGMAIRA